MRRHSSRSAAAPASTRASAASQWKPCAAGGPLKSGPVVFTRSPCNVTDTHAAGRSSRYEPAFLFPGELFDVCRDRLDIIIAQGLDGRRVLGIALDAAGDVTFRHLLEVGVAGEG